MKNTTPIDRNSAPSVVIIGGGLSGLSCAMRLADEGLRVTLFEKRGLLGGRASSFIDHDTGERIDNCQHVTMRCCVNLEDLLTRLGVADKIRYHTSLEFLDPQNRSSFIYGSKLPAPMHTAPSFMRFVALGMGDKLAVARGLISILSASPSPSFEAMSMADWLRLTHQPSQAIERFWRNILVSACNDEPDNISCEIGFKIFREGFLSNPTAYHMGVPTVTLADLYHEPGMAYLQARGVQVRMREHIDRINVRDGRVHNVTLNDLSTVQADYYVSAVPFYLITKLLDAEVIDATPELAGIRNLSYAPITGVHLWFDRALNTREAVSLLDREMHWIFTKSPNVLGAASDPPVQNTYLSLVVSSARRLADMPREDIIHLALRDVRECVPDAREANLLKALVVKERRATFTPMPGSARFRPDQRSPLGGLYLAGDWTRTGWPATMESAVRSGYLAAQRLLQDAGIKRNLLCEELPASGLARLIIP